MSFPEPKAPTIFACRQLLPFASVTLVSDLHHFTAILKFRNREYDLYT